MTDRVVIEPAASPKVGGPASDPDESNNTSMASFDVESGVSSPKADLAISSSLIYPQNPHVGEESTLAFEVKNMGPDPATGVQVISGIPMGVKVDGVSTGSFDSMTNLVNMPVGTLAPGDSKVLTVIVRPLSMGPNVIRAVARAHEVDPMPMNNSAMVQTMVQPSPAVAQVSFSGIHHQPTQMTVQFTGEVVGATATDISNYTLVDGGPSGIFGTGADRVVPIYNIAYDPSQFSAILVRRGIAMRTTFIS